MTGTELHNKLKTIEISGKKIVLKDLAAKLEMSEQNLQKRFKTKDVGYTFIKSVADALQIDVSRLTAEHNILEEPTPTYMKREKSQQPTDYKDQLIYCQQEQIRLQQKVEQLQDKLLAVYEQKKE